MKKTTREAKLKKLLGKMRISREVNALLLDIWREVDGAYADSDARQRAEIRDLKARLAAVRDTERYDGLTELLLSPEELTRRRATDLKNKNWRKP